MPQEKLRKDVISFKEKLQSHSIFDSIQSLKDLKTFSSLHIFVVWDYMSLVKSLQEGLNRRGTPWIPSKTPELTYLINSIALKEESAKNRSNRHKKDAGKKIFFTTLRLFNVIGITLRG